MNLVGAECDVRQAKFDLTDIELAWMLVACQQLRGECQRESMKDVPARMGEEGRNA